MFKSDEDFWNDHKLLQNVVELMALRNTPIEKLAEKNIWTLQRLSKSLSNGGIRIFPTVDRATDKLVIDGIDQHEEGREFLPFDLHPGPIIFIDNEVSAKHAATQLQALVNRYYALKPPTYERVKIVSSGDLSKPSEHDIFMRDNGMHVTYITSDRK